jgi:hypothetical protein
VSAARVAYYRAFVMLRWLVSCLAALDNGAKSQGRSVYFSIIALVEAVLPRALAQLAGVTLPAAAPAFAPEANDTGEVMDALVSDVATVLMPALAGDAQRRARGALLMSLHAAAFARFGAAVNAAEREALREVLGSEPGALADARRAVDARVAAASGSEDAAWIAWFARVAEARLALWPMVANLARKPLIEIPLVMNP